jgi:integrase
VNSAATTAKGQPDTATISARESHDPDSPLTGAGYRSRSYPVHGLRHTHATIALRAGVHPKVVSERLGHASVSFTLDVYTDLLPDMQETAPSLTAALVLEP